MLVTDTIMSGETFAPFDDALDAFLREAPAGTLPLSILAGRDELAAFLRWLAKLPGGPGPEPHSPDMEYGGLTVEPTWQGSHLSVRGAAPDGSVVRWPPPEAET